MLTQVGGSMTLGEFTETRALLSSMLREARRSVGSVQIRNGSRAKRREGVFGRKKERREKEKPRLLPFSLLFFSLLPLFLFLSSLIHFDLSQSRFPPYRRSNIMKTSLISLFFSSALFSQSLGSHSPFKPI